MRKRILACVVALFAAGGCEPPAVESPLQVRELKLSSFEEALYGPGSRQFAIGVKGSEAVCVRLNAQGDVAAVFVFTREAARSVSIERRNGVFPGQLDVTLHHAPFGMNDVTQTVYDCDVDGIPEFRVRWVRRSGKLAGDEEVVERIQWKSQGTAGKAGPCDGSDPRDSTATRPRECR